MNKSELKVIEESGLTLEQVQKSINLGYVNIDDIRSGNFEANDDGIVYNPDNFVNIDGEIHDIDSTWYCDYSQRRYSDDDYSVEIIRYDGRSETWLEDIAESNCEYYHEGVHYQDWSALRSHDLVYTEDTNVVMNEEDAYYCIDSGDWFEHPWNRPSSRSEEYVDDYHSGGYRPKNFTNNPTRFIGFEIEKEDHDVKTCMYIDDFKDATENLWRKERDGSLDDEDGFELISPTFEFCVDEIFKHIRGNQVLVDHINADKSRSCGGHIHLSVKGMSGKELFDSIKGYVPLFYALYHKRSDVHFCQAKSTDGLKSDNAKYQAIQILDNRIEFRIISAVPNVDVLEWRALLIELILNNPTSCFRTAYENILKLKEFSTHLRKAYPDNDKYAALKTRIKDMTTKFENINFNVSKFKELQNKAEENYQLERNRMIAKHNIDKLLKAISSRTGVSVRVVATNVDSEHWMFIGRVDVPFSVGDVLKITDFKRGCAIQVEGQELYFPMAMFEIVE